MSSKPDNKNLYEEKANKKNVVNSSTKKSNEASEEAGYNNDDNKNLYKDKANKKNVVNSSTKKSNEASEEAGYNNEFNKETNKNLSFVKQEVTSHIKNKCLLRILKTTVTLFIINIFFCVLVLFIYFISYFYDIFVTDFFGFKKLELSSDFKTLITLLLKSPSNYSIIFASLITGVFTFLFIKKK